MIMVAVGLVMHCMHQPEPIIMAWPISKLFIYARLSAALTNRKFD